MTKPNRDDDLAHCRATFETVAELVEGRGFDAPTIIDAMWQIALALSMNAFGAAVVARRLRDVADRIQASEGGADVDAGFRKH